MAKKEVVLSFLGNRIYYATVLKDGTAGSKDDITDMAIRAVAARMKRTYEETGAGAVSIETIGSLRYTPENEPTEISRLNAALIEKNREIEELKAELAKKGGEING